MQSNRLSWALDGPAARVAESRPIMNGWVPALLALLGSAGVAHAQYRDSQVRDQIGPGVRQGHELMGVGTQEAGLHGAPQEAPAPAAPGPTLEFTWTTPRWKGIELRAEGLSGACRLDVPDGIETRSNGFNPPLVERLEYDKMDFEAVGGGLVVDLDVFQLSADFFEGTWKGEGSLGVDDGISPATRTPLDVEGDFRALKVGLYWPTVRMVGDAFEFSLGADLKAVGFQMILDPVTSGPLPLEDRVDQLVGFAGPRAAFRFLAGRVEFSLEGAYSWVFGSSRGTAQEVSAGVGVRF